MIKLSAVLMILAGLWLSPPAAYADKGASRSVTIPISVLLAPDPDTIRSAAQDCADQTSGKGVDNQGQCVGNKRIYQTSRRQDDIIVTVAAI